MTREIAIFWPKTVENRKHSKLLTISEIQGFHGEDDWGNKLGNCLAVGIGKFFCLSSEY
jgi:hypothetical protein